MLILRINFSSIEREILIRYSLSLNSMPSNFGAEDAVNVDRDKKINVS